MFFTTLNNKRIKIVDELVLNNCFLLGQTSKLTNKNFTRYCLGARFSLEIFKLYEIRHLLLRTYPLIYNLFCKDRTLYDYIPWRRYPRKIKKRELEEYQKINPNWDGKMRFCTFRTYKNIPPKILFASSTPQYAQIIEEAAIRCQMPWQTKEWLNGSITANVSLLGNKETWDFCFDPKQVDIEKKFRKIYGWNKEDIEYTEEKKNLYGPSRCPTLILIPDVKNNIKLIEETREMNTPILGLVSSDCQLNIDYPILAQDMSIHIIHFFCHFMATLIAKEMAKIQHKLFIKTKSGLLRKDRNFFDKKISSRLWNFKDEFDQKYNAKKKPKIFVLQEKFFYLKRRIHKLIKRELFLDWPTKLRGLKRFRSQNSSAYFDLFYHFFYTPSQKEIFDVKEHFELLETFKMFMKNAFLRKRKYIFFLFETLRNSFTGPFFFFHLNRARTSPLIINTEWTKKKKLSNKNIYWTNPEYKRALLKAKKNLNSFETFLKHQWQLKKGRLRYNNANKMYYWIPISLLVQTLYARSLPKKQRQYKRSIIYPFNYKKKFEYAYQKYKKAWHKEKHKRRMKKFTKAGFTQIEMALDNCFAKKSRVSYF